MKAKIEFYNPQWHHVFKIEQEKINNALCLFNPDIEHIGSTAIKDVFAKPIIDILVGLSDENQLDEIVQPMITQGYCYIKKFETTMPYRRFFVKLKPLRNQLVIPKIIDYKDNILFGIDYDTEINIHVLKKHSFHWDRHIAFREYITAHKDIRDQYSELKQEIVKIELKDLLEYNLYKEDFIKEHQEKALTWYKKLTIHQVTQMKR